MAPIVSHRCNREISLAMPPQPLKVADNDDSPHRNTMQIEKAKTSELPPDPRMPIKVVEDDIDDESGDDSSIPEPHSNGGGNMGQEHEVSDGALAESEAMHETTTGDTTSSPEEPPSYIPAHLHESSAPRSARPYRDDGNEEKSREPGDTPTSVDQDIDGHPNIAHAGDPPSGQSTPTGYIHRRIPSSSIPHLLSGSNGLSSNDPQQLVQIQQQLGLVGVQGGAPTSLPIPTLPSRGSSREASFIFSVDGDDPAYKGLLHPSSPQIIPTIVHPQGSLVMNMDIKQGMVASLLEGCSSNLSLSSSASLASLGITPPHPSINWSSPPQKPGSQAGPNVLQLYHPISSTISPDKVASIDQENQGNAADVGNTQTRRLSDAGGPPCGLPLPLPNQLLPSNRRTRLSAVQPVLYSAINSLERYNAGSFDNKVMQAKARGTYGNQNAFPGVPKKKTVPDQAALSSRSNSVEGLESYSMDSELDSKNSSVISGLAGQRSLRSGIEEEDRTQLKGGTADTGKQTEGQMGAEQLTPILRRQPSERFYKSKSSGHLSENDSGGRPESLEQLKGGPKKTDNIKNRSVSIRDDDKPTSRRGRRTRREKKVGVFRPSSDAYTPRMANRAIKYKPAEERACVEKISSTMGTIQRPNFRDALRRVAIILHQHIVKIEHRFSTGVRGVDDTGLFKTSMRDHFNEDNFATPRYKCSMVRIPMARPGVVYSMRKIRVVHKTPTTDEIYEFAHQLFKKVQLSSECSIVCLIYVEKLMEVAKVPLVAETWKPIFMCGLLLASKVWQDLSSWNIEFACVYPQFSLDAINRLELSFLKFIKWDLYISSSLYAKYYFALRSLLEKSGFRDRYNQMVGGIGGIAASEAAKVAKRSEAVKEEALLQLSRSM